MKKMKIALVPTRRGISSNRKGAFTVEDALEAKKSVFEYLSAHNTSCDVEFINIDCLNDEGIMFDDAHADFVADYLKKQDIDGIFILHCNFGCEEAVGRVCKMLRKPVFLWGARDRAIAEDGSRSTDTQCGLFASSRLLRRYGVPFTYALNCAIEDEEFSRRFNIFLGAVRVVYTIQHTRIGLINARPKYFTSVMVNESSLLEQFGIEVVPINITVVMKEMDRIRSKEAASLDSACAELKERMDCTETSSDKVKASVCLTMALKNLAKTFNLNGLAIECWTLMPNMIGALPCLAIGELTDCGIMCCCEGDIYGVISSILLHAVCGDTNPPFFGEYTMRHSADDNMELIWHCGNAPYSLKCQNAQTRFVDGRESFALKNGPITITRFDCDRNQFYFFAEEAEAVDGPFTTGTYLWAKMKNWKDWEYKFMEGPYIHHVSVAYGKYREILRESCKYIPQLTFDCMSS